MLKNTKQQIKLTIHKTEIVSNMIQSFYLKMNANEITFITDKITEKFYDYNKVFNSLQRVLSSIYKIQNPHKSISWQLQNL